jgi:hypothetical protein
MFQALVGKASRLLMSLRGSLLRQDRKPAELPELPGTRGYQRLRQVVLADELSRDLFQQYAAHRAGPRGEEEIGWVLLGIRDVDRAMVLAALPAGARREAGVAHVQFDCNAQAVATRLLRQGNKRLTTLGVVHTHPGDLCHPSNGDFLGDSQWVRQLPGEEGVFGIGTADRKRDDGLEQTRQPDQHCQLCGPLRMSWFALGRGDRHYRPLDVQLTAGPDLALPLHDIWATIEEFALPLERLWQQQAGMSTAIVPGQRGPALAISLKLAPAETALRIVLEGREAAFYWQRGQELLAVDPPRGPLDRSVYLVLADLAGQS